MKGRLESLWYEWRVPLGIIALSAFAGFIVWASSHPATCNPPSRLCRQQVPFYGHPGTAP